MITVNPFVLKYDNSHYSNPVKACKGGALANWIWFYKSVSRAEATPSAKHCGGGIRLVRAL